MTTDKAEFLIEGRNVSKVFKDFWGRPKVRAVIDVDIQVPKGAVFGLLGPNGAGKSTLIKMILGHLYPTGGVLTVFGHHPTDVKSKARLGYLPERAFLYKHLTPMQTLRFFGEVLELPSDVIRSRSEQLLDMVGLRHARDRIVGEFSHGMGRRMGLAQALLNDPDLLLLDEPTAGLDPLGCRDVKDLILTLAARGKTILLTSHLLADVEEVSDQLMIMYGGRVQAVGTSQELLSQRDMLQITLPAPDAARKEQILAAVGDDVQVSSPLQTLENYFLDVVRQASKSQDTYGAQAGSGVATYLKTAEPKPEEPEPQPTPEPPKKAEPAETVPIEPASEATPEAEPKAEAEPEHEAFAQLRRDDVPPEPAEDSDEPDEDIDQDLLDELTK